MTHFKDREEKILSKTFTHLSLLGHKFSIYLRFCQKGGRIIEEGDKAKTVELMNPGVLYPEEMSQTKGSLRVKIGRAHV